MEKSEKKHKTHGFRNSVLISIIMAILCGGVIAIETSSKDAYQEQDKVVQIVNTPTETKGWSDVKSIK